MKKENGITLIALVVTIVVLIILAAVSISMLTGENGIITQAIDSKNDTIVGREKESIALAYSNCKAQNQMENVTTEQLQNELNYNGENAYVTGTENKLIVTFKDTKNSYTINQNGKIEENGPKEEYKDATIPNGFYYVGGTVESGIVISDNINDKDKYKDQSEVGTDLEGNQFVWIPVTNGEDYLEANDSNLYDIDSQIEKENKDISESIKKYGGFFVSRYEISEENGKFISKSGKIADNNVTLQQAINNSRTMYPKENSSYGASSTLIYGKQWDLMMDYLSDKYNLSNSSSYGNYYDSGEKEINNETISITSGTAPIECSSSGKKQKIEFSIQLGSSSANVYMRFKVLKSSGDFELSEEVEENENIIKRGDYYYYTPIITRNDKITVPLFLDIGGTSNREDTSVEAKIRVDVIQAVNFNPDFTIEEPWGDVEIEEYGKININNNRIEKVSNLKINDEFKIAYFTDFVERKVSIILKANTVKNTGSNTSWQTNNIYDLAGNLEEWTIDKENQKYLTRGGKYFGTDTSITGKTEVGTSTSEDYIGYRSILYIK